MLAAACASSQQSVYDDHIESCGVYIPGVLAAAGAAVGGTGGDVGGGLL